jgi:hypothetical protein
MPVVEARLPGFRDECEPLARWADQVFEHKPNDQVQQIVVDQCQHAWHLFGSIAVLTGYSFGVSGMIVSRALFELVAGPKYLMKNPVKPKTSSITARRLDTS